MQQIINHSLINYKAFFGWLYVAIVHLIDTPVPPDVLNMTQQDQANIAEFLQIFDSINDHKSSGFVMERVGQYLVDAELKIQSDTRGNEWENFLKTQDCVLENEGIMKHSKEMSLVQQFKRLKENVKDVFADVECVQSEFKLVERINCVDFPENGLSMSQVNFDRTSTFFVILPEHREKGLFLNVTYENKRDFKTTAGNFFFEDHQNRYTILDVKFYSPNVLSLLLEETSTKKAVICQFPALTASDTLSLVDIKNKICRQHLPETNGLEIEGVLTKTIEGMPASKFSVSGNRRVCIVLSENKRKVRLFEMEAEEEDEEEGDATMSMVKESDVSMVESNEASHVE